MQTVSYSLRESQVKAIEQIAQESKLLTDVPDLSKSHVARQIFDLGIAANDGITDLVGEATRIKLRQEQFMENEGWLNNQRSGFRTQVEKHFRTRFENGYNAEEIEKFAANMRMKAHIFWPEDIGEDYSEEREAALSYVDNVAKNAKEAAKNSDYDPLDPNGIFSDYEGVERGRAQAEAEASITEHVETALDFITDKKGGTAGRDAKEPEQVIEILRNRSDVPEGVAEKAVEGALDVIETVPMSMVEQVIEDNIGLSEVEAVSEITVDTSPGAGDRAATDGGDR